MPVHLSLRRTLLSFGAALAAAGLTACATPPGRPDGAAAGIDLPATWSQALSAPTSESSGAWWRDFGSAELDRLVAAALEANRDLRIAASRVAQARSLASGTDADRLPQVAALAAGSHGRKSLADPKADSLSAGVQARWEIDVFGRAAQAVDAADADASSAAQALQAARAMVAADVASAYFAQRIQADRLALAREASAVSERLVQVTRRKFEAGQSSTLDLARAEAELAQQRAAIEQLDGERRLQLRQLALLLGTAQAPVLESSALATADPPAPAARLPGEWLERRPDVRRQAHALDAALARVGVARRELYPRLEIDWVGLQQRLAVQRAKAATQIVVGHGVTLSLPLFDGGRIRANIEVHEAKAQEAMAEYEKALLAALADADSALTRWVAADSGLREWKDAQRAAREVLERSERLHVAGQADLAAVLEARRNLVRVQDARCQVEAARWMAAVGLRRAFGGAV